MDFTDVNRRLGRQAHASTYQRELDGVAAILGRPPRMKDVLRERRKVLSQEREKNRAERRAEADRKLEVANAELVPQGHLPIDLQELDDLSLSYGRDASVADVLWERRQFLRALRRKGWPTNEELQEQLDQDTTDEAVL